MINNSTVGTLWLRFMLDYRGILTNIRPLCARFEVIENCGMDGTYLYFHSLYFIGLNAYIYFY